MYENPNEKTVYAGRYDFPEHKEDSVIREDSNSEENKRFDFQDPEEAKETVEEQEAVDASMEEAEAGAEAEFAEAIEEEVEETGLAEAIEEESEETELAEFIEEELEEAEAGAETEFAETIEGDAEETESAASRLDAMYAQIERESQVDEDTDSYPDDTENDKKVKKSKASKKAKEPKNSDRTKKQTGPIIAIIVVIIALLAIVGFLAYKYFLKNDKLIVSKAFSEFAVELKEYQDSYMTTAQVENLVNQVLYGDVAGNVSVNVSGIPNIPVTVGVDGDIARSFDNQELSVESELSVMNAKVTDVKVYADGNDLYVYLPILLDETMMANTEQLAEKINASPLAEVIGLTIPEGVDYRPFGDGQKKVISLIDWSTVLVGNESKLASLGEAMEVSREKEKETITLADGTEMECGVYHIVLTKDTVTPILEDVFNIYLDNVDKNVEALEADEYLGDGKAPEDRNYSINLGGDVNITVLIDEDGNLREIKSDAPIAINGVTVDCDSTFTGSDVLFDQTKAGVSIVDSTYSDFDENNDLDQLMASIANETYDFDWAVAPNGKITTTISTSGDVSSVSSFEGKVNFDEATETLTANIDGLDVDYGAEQPLRISGTVVLSTADVKVITHPTKDVIDILNLNFLDMLKITGELVQKYESIINLGKMLGL